MTTFQVDSPHVGFNSGATKPVAARYPQAMIDAIKGVVDAQDTIWPNVSSFVRDGSYQLLRSLANDPEFYALRLGSAIAYLHQISKDLNNEELLSSFNDELERAIRLVTKWRLRGEYDRAQKIIVRLVQSTKMISDEDDDMREIFLQRIRVVFQDKG